MCNYLCKCQECKNVKQFLNDPKLVPKKPKTFITNIGTPQGNRKGLTLLMGELSDQKLSSVNHKRYELKTINKIQLNITSEEAMYK